MAPEVVLPKGFFRQVAENQGFMALIRPAVAGRVGSLIARIPLYRTTIHCRRFATKGSFLLRWWVTAP